MRWWRWVRVGAAVLALVAIVAQLVEVLDAGRSALNFFSFFTIQSNLIGLDVLLFLAIARTAPTPTVDRVRGAATVYLTITGIVYALLLSGDPAAVEATIRSSTVLHRVMPVMMVADWLLFPPSTRIPAGAAGWWLVYPLAWTAYTLVRGTIGLVPSTRSSTRRCTARGGSRATPWDRGRVRCRDRARRVGGERAARQDDGRGLAGGRFALAQPLEAVEQQVEGELELELVVAPGPTTDASSWASPTEQLVDATGTRRPSLAHISASVCGRCRRSLNSSCVKPIIRLPMACITWWVRSIENPPARNIPIIESM